MEKTNLWPRPLDEKNMTTDWIEEVFGEKGWMETPFSRNGQYQFLTYICDTLIKVTWNFGENQLCFIVLVDIEGCEEYLREKAEKALGEIKKRMQKLEADENEFPDADGRLSCIRYNETKDRIDFFFYWDYKDND